MNQQSLVDSGQLLVLVHHQPMQRGVALVLVVYSQCHMSLIRFASFFAVSLSALPTLNQALVAHLKFLQSLTLGLIVCKLSTLLLGAV